MREHLGTPSDRTLAAARALHRYLGEEHLGNGVLAGPDSGVKWNFHAGRFVKSYLSPAPWGDNHVFQQTQGYWILANWRLWELTAEPAFAEHARRGADAVVEAQQAEGYWQYPSLRSRRGFVATVEGDIATIALAESFRLEGRQPWIESARRWHRYLLEAVRFQDTRGGSAINYWAGSSDAIVPNNTTLTLWMLASLFAATGDSSMLDRSASMLSFLRSAQLESGELPYMLEPEDDGEGRVHFLCYQYNAFQCLDLIHYLLLTEDSAVRPIIELLAAFLATGVTPSGAVKYDCHSERPVVPYYAAATGAALSQASRLGLGDFAAKAERVYGWVKAQQAPSGGMKFFSRRNYAVLRDTRSYPRNLAMILYHLALESYSDSREHSTEGRSGAD